MSFSPNWSEVEDLQVLLYDGMTVCCALFQLFRVQLHMLYEQQQTQFSNEQASDKARGFSSERNQCAFDVAAVERTKQADTQGPTWI